MCIKVTLSLDFEKKKLRLGFNIEKDFKVAIMVNLRQY